MEIFVLKLKEGNIVIHNLLNQELFKACEVIIKFK